MAVSLTLGYKVNSQNVENNTSNVTVTAGVSWTYGSYNHTQKPGFLVIDGKTYNFTSSFNPNKTTSGSQVIFSKTVDVVHESDGTKTLVCGASYTTGVSSGTIQGSFSRVLTTIPRKSSLSASNGTLGTAQTLTVTRQADSFTHTITYKCGTASGTVCSKSSATSISWTPPLSLASQNTTGTSVTVSFTITTYSGDTSIGSNTKAITCAMPASVKPYAPTITVNPASNRYVQGVSKLSIQISGAAQYGASIESYKTEFEGKTFAGSLINVGVVSKSGTQTIKTTVTDSRGRTNTSSATVYIRPYTPPVITKLTVHRCDEDGTANDQGAYVNAVISYKVSSGASSSLASLEYKKASESTYTTVALPIDDQFTVTDYSYTFPADTGSSYDVRLTVSDDYNTVKLVTSASTAYTILHFGADGRSVSVGKISEISDLFDIGMMIRFMGGILPPILEPETNLNNVRTPNTYIGANVTYHKYSNCPLASGTFVLTVEGAGNADQIRQRLTRCHKTEPTVWERFYYSDDGDGNYAWGEWQECPAMIDSGWQTLAINASMFKPYDTSAVNAARYRKIGKMVEVRGIVAPAVEIAGSSTSHVIATLPTGFRPDCGVYTLCQGSGNCVWLLQVAANGNILFSRYRNGATATTISASGAWLPFHITFFVN